VQELEWFFKDRTKWESGAWDNEPDKAQWTDAATGLPCLIHRNYFGAWCGYVGVSPDLITYLGGLDITDTIDVHGGITYQSMCAEHTNDVNGEGIGHVPESGEPDTVFWFGFDCSHHMDMGPANIWTIGLSYRGTYRDMAYVKAECASLAQQLMYIG
jgi:hypothetical protein